jgi:hypothetical protein
MGPGRFELPTSRLSGVRSNQLSYEPGSIDDCLLIIDNLLFTNESVIFKLKLQKKLKITNSKLRIDNSQSKKARRL